MALTYGDTLRATLSLLFVLTLAVTFLAETASSAIIYDRKTYILDIWKPQEQPEEIANNLLLPPRSYGHRHGCRKRGKRGGVLARLRQHPTRPPLPSKLLANVQSLDNKLDDLHCEPALRGT